MKGKAVEVLGTEDVATDMSQMQQSYMLVVSSIYIERSCVNLIDPGKKKNK